MLKVLREIVQSVDNAENLEVALSIVVRAVCEHLDTDSCSIFLKDHASSDYVLMATEGLNAKMVGKLRVPMNRGLVGWVGQNAQILNLDDAPSHPEFHITKKVGEEQYRAFLGVPIMYHREVLGVLLTQQTEARRYDEEAEALLVTLSSQLSGSLAHAESNGFLIESKRRAKRTKKNTLALGGLPASPGVAIGKAMVIYPPADLDAIPDMQVEDVEKEIAEFLQALAAVKADIKAMQQRMVSTLNDEEYVLFDAYFRILEGSSWEEQIVAEINQGQWAQGAVRRVVKRHIQRFESMEDEYLRERSADIRDLGERLLAELHEADKESAQEFPDNVILVGREITASDLAHVPVEKLLGIVSSKGSSNSHVAILARAMGTPAVLGVDELPFKQIDGHEVIVDGFYGQVFVDPSKGLLKEFNNLAAEEREFASELTKLRDEPAVTKDGYRICLQVNAGLAVDMGRSLTVGAEGVGLYRSEVPFMSRDRFPSEEEQYTLYSRLLGSFAPRPVVIRSLDIGGDKKLPYFPIQESNPFLGWRGIRISLDHPEIFMVQLKAMLRAHADWGNLRILFPMVATLEELDDALEFLQQAYDNVRQENPELQMPEVGVMIEIPATILLAKPFIKRVDFVSVGSNDLTQYLLAVDRNNAKVANLYDGLHPAVLHAIKVVVDEGRLMDKPVCICGELASDPIAAAVLIALGVNSLSMNATSIPRVKWLVRNIQLSELKAEVLTLLSMDNALQIRAHVEQFLEQRNLTRILRAGR